MNAKEISELRRRWTAEKNSVNHIYGCFVNGNHEIVSDLDEAVSLMSQDEAEKYLALFKKTLSGTQGKNLIDIVFATEQVVSGEEHRLLMALRDSELKDNELRQEFYRKVIGSLELEGNYLLLLAQDAYDVPRKGKDGAGADSEEVFRYFICSLCPVKELPSQLGYFPGDNEFHYTVQEIVSAPEAGFMFPAFDDRAANIYNALYYTRKPDEPHCELISAVFGTEPPMTAAEQREAFEGALSEALGDSCSLEVVRSVCDGLDAMLKEHKESRDPEPLTVTAKDVGLMLRDCGVEQERESAFLELCAQSFGEGAALKPENLVDTKRFEVKTENASVVLASDSRFLVETRVIDGRRYLLIPAEESVEVNGLAVHIAGEEA